MALIQTWYRPIVTDLNWSRLFIMDLPPKLLVCLRERSVNSSTNVDQWRRWTGRTNCKLAPLATTGQKSTPPNVWTWKGSVQHSLQPEWWFGQCVGCQHGFCARSPVGSEPRAENRRAERREPSRPNDMGFRCGLARACSGTRGKKHQLVEFNEMAEVSGRKVLGGLMGVAKGGNDRNTGPRCLIMNIKVSNCAQHAISGDMPQLPSSGQRRCLILENGETQVLFLCVRDSKAPAQVDGLCSRGSPQLLLSGQHWGGLSLFESGAHGMDFCHWCHSTCPSSFADVTVAPSARPERYHNELFVARGTADSVWQPRIRGNPFRVSRAVELYARWLPTREDLLCGRRPHHSLAEPPTPVLSGAVHVASVKRQPRRARVV